ncbi:hypothetical protein SCHPADRAFT_944534 [Schizopora paradoxa]|uniref:Uncharacterized protein n=1 Tax=Schizopora paradoxa TaxID=27342 RepID=A0A0H2RU35_9AGAM|nr:hypothetical protein SCHPADRAFT_944534 [Schizopora paradoxa]
MTNVSNADFADTNLSSSPNLTNLPPELLLQIFAFAANDYSPDNDFEVSITHNGLWDTDLRTKKAIIRVCKTWRDVGLEGLYHRVSLRYIGQLCALVRTLGESAVKYDGAGYAMWIRHIHLNVFVPEMWEVFTRNVAKLLGMSSSCQSISWNTEWDSTQPCYPQSSSSNILALYKHNLTPTLSSLRKLAFTLDNYPPYEGEIDADRNVTFPNLEELTCEMRMPSALQRSKVISQDFIMPNLRRLTITLPWDWPQRNIESEQVAHIFAVLEAHGEKLSFLALDTLALKSGLGAKSVVDVLRLAPNLEHLRCSSLLSTGTLPLKSPYRTLKRLEILTLAIEEVDPYRSGLDMLMNMAGDRKNLPNLTSITMIYQRFPSTTINGASQYAQANRIDSFGYFMAWAKQCREWRIALLGVGGEPLISEEEEKEYSWTDYNEEGSDSDDTYVNESESDDDISTESGSESDASEFSVNSVEAVNIFESILEHERLRDESSDDSGDSGDSEDSDIDINDGDA